MINMGGEVDEDHLFVYSYIGRHGPKVRSRVFVFVQGKARPNQRGESRSPPASIQHGEPVPSRKGPLRS